MDECSRKRSSERLAARKIPGLVHKDSDKGRIQYSRMCSRLSCSSRLASSESTKSGKTPSNGKEIVGSSSRTGCIIGKSKKSTFESRMKLPSRSESKPSQNGGIKDEQEGSDLIPPGKIQRGLHAHSKGCNSINGGSSMEALNSRSAILVGAKNVSSASSAGSNHCVLRKLKSNLNPSSCCSSTKSHNGMKDIPKTLNSEKESSSISRGKMINGSLPRRNINSSQSISISDTRITRNAPPRSQLGGSLARTGNSVNGNIRTSLSVESSSMSSRIPRRNLSINGNASTSSNQSSTKLTSRRPFSYTQPRNSIENLVRPASPAELGTNRSFRNRESFQSYNIDGVAEVLLALERVEQDEELAYEQAMLLETSLFLENANLFDQHRDMRLDIDHMSYEELLALEERMGTVSTALTEDALSRCLKRSIFQSNNDGVGCCSDDKDDVKCCICQEEYVNGDTVGRLECKHRYHEECIQQWLRQKNWCPTCKAPAEHPGRPSSSSS